MVKLFLSFVLLFSFSFSQELISESNTTTLEQKIQSFMDVDVYEENKAFIKIIFSPNSDFYLNDRIDVVKVLSTLKDNGLVKLFFNKPQELNLHFKTSGTPLFFVKLMSDSLRNIGYYRYVTTASELNNSEFIWSISLNTEYATDPQVLQNELEKVGCKIVDVERNSYDEWTYSVDIASGYLNIEVLEDRKKHKLKRSLYAHWLDSSQIQSLKIVSSSRNNWYPNIAYYDSSLHLLKVIKKDEKQDRILLEIPKRAKYIKVSDIYTLKNIKDELTLYPSGRK